MSVKFFYIQFFISITIVVFSFLAILLFSLPLSQEFTGTSKVVVETEDIEPIKKEILNTHDKVSVFDAKTEYSISLPYLDENGYLQLVDVIEKNDGKIKVYESFSPSISGELVRKSIIAIIVASFLILLFVTFAFRSVSKPVSSWKYGFAAIVAIVHDMSIPIGIFAILGLYTQATVDILFVTAMLAVLGYSVNDTIIVFDRVRERLLKTKDERFEDSVSYGIKNSIRRSVYTSLTTIIPLAILFMLVPVTRWFGVALFIGILVGTYSSLFFAPSILVIWNRLFKEEEKTDSEKSQLEIAEEKLRERLKGEEE